MSEQINSHERLTNVEERLTRLESLLISINEKLEPRSDVGEVDTEKAEEFRQWVTNYVSMRLYIHKRLYLGIFSVPALFRK